MTSRHRVRRAGPRHRGSASPAPARASRRRRDEGDRAAVQKLILQKADVNAPQVDGATALHWAVYRDDVELADIC